jgi:hypothetical protein
MKPASSEEFRGLTKAQQFNYRKQAEACINAANKVSNQNSLRRPDGGLNKAERKILRTVIHNVAHHNKDLWWELKREIWDRGYQTVYWSMGVEYLDAAERALKRLTPSEKQALIGEWGKANPTDAELPDSKIVLSYALLIVEEVVERARSAAYRTTNW